MISTTAVDHLMQLGRRRGGLHIDHIRQVLPVDTMTIEELADVLARLEEAGIAFEIDAGMLTPHHRKMTLRGVNPMKEPMRQRTSNDGSCQSIRSSIVDESGGGEFAPHT